MRTNLILAGKQKIVIRGSFKEFSRDQLDRSVAVAPSQLDFFSPHLFSANDRSIIISTISNYGYSALL